MNLSGQLTIKPLKADLRRDTETFSTMDPYCQIVVNGQTFKTKVHNDGGMKPVWNDTFNAKVNIYDEMRIEVFNYRSLGSNDLLGEAKVLVSTFTQMSRCVQDVVLNYQQYKNTGTITIEFQWYPTQGQQQGQQQQFIQQQNYQQQQVGYQQGMYPNLQQQQPLQQQGFQQQPYQQGGFQQGGGFQQQQPYQQQMQGGGGFNYPQQQQQFQQQQQPYQQQQQPFQQQQPYQQQQFPMQQPYGTPWNYKCTLPKGDIKKFAQQIFYKYDRDRSGTLDERELYAALQELFVLLNHPPPHQGVVYQLMNEYSYKERKQLKEKEFRVLVKDLCGVYDDDKRYKRKKKNKGLEHEVDKFFKDVGKGLKKLF